MTSIHTHPSVPSSYVYVDKDGTALAGSLQAIGETLLWGGDDASGDKYRGYGVSRLTDNPEPWCTYTDDGDVVPREFTESEWVEWASFVEDRHPGHVLAALAGKEL